MAKVDPNILNQRAIQEREIYEYKKKVNDLIKEDNDISKAYGGLLNEHIKKEGKITNIIKNRVDLVNEISAIKESDAAHSEKAMKINDKMKAIEEKIANARDKSGKFQKGFNHQVLKGLKTDRALLKVERDKEAALKDVTKLQTMQGEKLFGMFEKVTTKIKSMPGGGMLLEAVGLGDKSMAQMKKNMGEFMAGNKKFKDVFNVKGSGGAAGMTKTLSGGSVSMAAMAASAAVLVVSIGLIVGLFVVMYKIATAFSAVTDKMGKAFGVMGTQSNAVTQNLRGQRAEAAMIGKNIEDLISVTTTLSDQFGVGMDASSAIAGNILDSSVAMGLSNEEGSKLYGTLMGIAGLSFEQAKHLSHSTFQMAQANNVNPSAVMRDMADSASVIAKFGADNLDSITKAAVQARKMGMALKDVESIASGLLDFQNSLNKEIEASVLLGRNINLQKARELALTGDLTGMMDVVLDQVGGEAEFNDLNVLQRQALADALNVDIGMMQKLVREQGRGTKEAESFTEMLGKDGMSTLTSMINKIKSLGVTFIEEVGPEIEKIVQNISDWLEAGGFDTLISGAKSLANVMISIVSNMDKVLAVLGALAGAAIGFMIGGPVGALIGAAVGGVAGYFTGSGLGATDSAASGNVTDVSDFSTSGGSHLIVRPNGQVLKTNPNDFISGTTKVNDFQSGPPGSMGSNDKVEKQLDNLNRTVGHLTKIMNDSLGGVNPRLARMTSAGLATEMDKM